MPHAATPTECDCPIVGAPGHHRGDHWCGGGRAGGTVMPGWPNIETFFGGIQSSPDTLRSRTDIGGPPAGTDSARDSVARQFYLGAGASHGTRRPATSSQPPSPLGHSKRDRHWAGAPRNGQRAAPRHVRHSGGRHGRLSFMLCHFCAPRGPRRGSSRLTRLPMAYGGAEAVGE